MFIPDNLELYEILPEQFYKDNYPIYKERLWMMFDYRLLLTYHHLRRRYRTAVLNTWYWGGRHQYRGWRPWNCKVGAKFSQHKFGRAFDIIFKYNTTDQVRNEILLSPHAIPFKFITGIEMEVLWLHVDCGNRNRHEAHLDNEVIQKIYV